MSRKTSKPAQSIVCGCCRAQGLRVTEGVYTVAQAVARITERGWTVQTGAAYCSKCSTDCECKSGVGPRCGACQERRLGEDLRASLRKAS